MIILCPISSWTVRMSTPAMTSPLANVCRRSCQRDSWMPQPLTPLSVVWSDSARSKGGHYEHQGRSSAGGGGCVLVSL